MTHKMLQKLGFPGELPIMGCNHKRRLHSSVTFPRGSIHLAMALLQMPCRNCATIEEVEQWNKEHPTL